MAYNVVMTHQTPTKVALGTHLHVEVRRGGETATEELTVGLSCGTNAGQWYCVTHDRGFRNNFEKDSHCSGFATEGEPHELAWICFEHGAEVP